MILGLLKVIIKDYPSRTEHFARFLEQILTYCIGRSFTLKLDFWRLVVQKRLCRLVGRVRPTSRPRIGVPRLDF